MSRALSISIVLVTVGGLARAEAPAKTPGQAAFEAATALEAKSQYREAADALEKLAREQPDDTYAADALFEAAVIAEERLGSPARARELYEAVATKYPHSRLQRRARARADFLAGSLRTGEGPLREYDDILANVPRRTAAESTSRMEALLSQHPDFALADRALFWLGAAYAEQHRDADATTRFREIERRFPTTEWASRARKGRADLLMRARHPLEARALYAQLADSGDPLARAAGLEGLAWVRQTLRRWVMLLVAALYLVAFFALHGILLQRKKARLWPPTEVLYYAPVAALFVIAAVTEAPSIALATVVIALGGLFVVWASGALSVARLADGALPIRARVGRAAATALAVLCVAYVAVQTTGLTDLVLETLRSGPER